MPKSNSQQPKSLITFADAFRKFESTVEDEVEKALRSATHAFFKVKRIPSQDCHRQLVESALSKYVDDKYDYKLMDTDEFFEVIIVPRTEEETDMLSRVSTPGTIVIDDGEEKKEGWIRW